MINWHLVEMIVTLAAIVGFLVFRTTIPGTVLKVVPPLFPSSPARAAGGVVAVIVHGTFAPDAEWVEVGSPLVRELVKSFDVPVEVIRFRWPGLFGFFNNSHTSRLKAAKRLRELLEDISRRRSPSKLFVIAHSHGGNVALYALNEPPFILGIDGLICLATPFVTALPRTLPDPLVTFFRTLVWISYVLILILVGVGTLAFVISRAPSDTDGSSLGLLSLPIMIVLMIGVLAVVRVLLDAKFLKRAISRWETWCMGLFRKRAQEISSALTCTLHKDTPMFCAWIASDEAYFGLHMVDTLRGGPFSFFKFLFSDEFSFSAMKSLGLVVLGISVLFWIINAIFWLHESLGFGVLALFTLPVFILIGVMVLAVIAIVGGWIIRSVYPLTLAVILLLLPLRFVAYGWTNVDVEYLCDITVSQIPSWYNTITDFTAKGYPEVIGGLHHSLHSHPTVLADVSEWLHKRAAASPQAGNI